MVRPNFFIIGAPKCGTTALSEYLRQHPKIGFSRPKEPIYFATDLPKVCNFSDEKTYLEDCFGHCAGQDLQAIGEGSTSYFFSKEAAANILRFEPQAKFIIMLRKPSDMIHAMHAQKLLSLEEDVPDFEQAWSLQRERAEGRELPKFCREPSLLQYAEMGKLGRHLQRHFAAIPEPQRLVILFDDFTADTRAVYAKVLDFLDIPDDGRKEFVRVNERKAIRSLRFYQFAHRPPQALMSVVFALKRVLGIERLNILDRLNARNVKRSRAAPLSDGMRATLLREFSEDIDLLGNLLDRDLSHWKS